MPPESGIAISSRVRPSFTKALRISRALAILAEFDPRVAGTLPLGLAMPDSDIDVICHVTDPERFVATIWREFATYPQFSMRQWRQDGRPIIASFVAHGWPIEIFGQELPVDRQTAWRHFSVEKRLLAFGGDDLRNAVIANRQSGAKTEAAFATALGIGGDPYQAMLDVESLTDGALMEMIARSQSLRTQPITN